MLVLALIVAGVAAADPRTNLFTPSLLGHSVLRLTDAASGRPVYLVGTMHYNPHSIAVVRGAVNAAARQHGLHATAVELCSSRWDRTAAARWREKRTNEIPAYQRLLSEDEFQVAWESSAACGVHDVVLADQAISLTGRRLAAALATTAVDMLTPPAGWRRVAADLRIAQSRLSTHYGGVLSRTLLAGAPLALARYLYQSPSAAPFLGLSAAALGIAAAIDEATGAAARGADGDEPPARAVVAVLGMAHLAGVREALLRVDAAPAAGAAPADGPI
jgi:hypothetical protein